MIKKQESKAIGTCTHNCLLHIIQKEQTASTMASLCVHAHFLHLNVSFLCHASCVCMCIHPFLHLNTRAHCIFLCHAQCLHALFLHLNASSSLFCLFVMLLLVCFHSFLCTLMKTVSYF